MRPRRSTRIAAMAVAICAAASAPTRRAAADVRWGPDYFPNVPLTTQDGKTVRFYDDLLKDKRVAITLMYTRCKFGCPLESARLAQVQRLLGDRVGKDIFFYSISIEPDRDTPEVLKAYAQKFHAGPGWLFLTGKQEDVLLIARKLGLYVDRAASDDGHTPSLMIGNVATGRWMRNSAVDNPRFLARTITTFLDGYRGAPAGKSYAEAAPLSLRSKGQYVFSSQCAACHTIGGGDRVGPDLMGVTTLRSREWLTRFIAAPDRVLAEGDPIAAGLYAKYKVNMPNLALGTEDVAALIEYLAAETAAVAQRPAPPATARAAPP